MRRVITVPVALGATAAVVTVDALASIEKKTRKLVGIVFDQVAGINGLVVFNQETIVNVISSVMGSYAAPIIPMDVDLKAEDSLYVGYNDTAGTSATKNVTLLFDE